MKRHAFLVGFTVLAAGLSLFRLGRNSFSLDETITIMVSKEWNAMWSILRKDEQNMWLYHILVNRVLQFGDNEWLVRGLSAAAAILTVLVFYQLARRVGGELTAQVATPLLVLNTLFVFYAQTARSYSLMLLMVTLAGYTFFGIATGASRRRDVTLFVACTVLALYSHFLSGFVFASFAISLVFFPVIPWKKMVVAALVIALFITPIFMSLYFPSHQIDWMEKPPLVYLPLTFLVLSGDSLVAAALWGFLIMFVFWTTVRRPPQEKHEQFTHIWLFLWAAFPPAAGFIFSYLVKPIYEPEHFVMSLPALILLASIGLVQLARSKRWHHAFLAMYATLLVASGFRLSAWYRGSSYPQWVIENRNPRSWRDIAAFIGTVGKSEDAVIFYAYHIQTPFVFYFDKIERVDKPTIVEIASSDYIVSGGTTLPEPNRVLLDRLPEMFDRVWLVSSYHKTERLQRRNQWRTVEQSLTTHFNRVRNIIFGQVEVELFEK